jgi:DNA-binding response OmpR family regulator
MALTASSSPPSSQNELGALQGKRVLLVDDDPVLLRVWQRTLTQRGMLVRTATGIEDARQALSLWPSRPFQYALIDDRLSDGFGLDLVPSLLQLRPVPGFAVVSAFPSTERALRAWQREVIIVPKPAHPNGLFELLGFLETRRGKERKTHYKRGAGAREAARFGRFTLDADGLTGPTGQHKLTAVGLEIFGRLLQERGGWLATGDLARELYDRDDAQSRMLIRRHVSLLRRALGDERWVIESALQRGYRLAPQAFSEA